MFFSVLTKKLNWEIFDSPMGTMKLPSFVALFQFDLGGKKSSENIQDVGNCLVAWALTTLETFGYFYGILIPNFGDFQNI